MFPSPQPRQNIVTNSFSPLLILYSILQPLLFPYTVKKRFAIFPSPAGITTKLSLGGNNDVITELFLPRRSLVSDIPVGDGKLVNLFLRCMFVFNGGSTMFPSSLSLKRHRFCLPLLLGFMSIKAVSYLQLTSGP
jgi:hypothetical protein